MLQNNRVRKLLGIDYPILQGGMAWVADAELASAVSNGGGLGVIAAGNMPPDLLEKEIRKVKSLTDKPFGVNIMLLSPTAEEAVEVVARARVPVVTTGAGSPGKVIERLKPLGTKILPVIASVAHAKRVARQGADAVIAEGMEAGGHIGEITSMVLVPQIVDTVDIPVIAAGGIADARAVVAAFALGAEGVQVGTRFACCLESTAHEAYKREIIKAAMVPFPRGTASCISRPRRCTSRTPSARLSAPPATRAEYSPRLCPATYAGSGSKPSSPLITEKTAILTVRIAGWANAVFFSSSSGPSRISFPR